MKNLRYKNGFTLVELLAVIVILAVIMIIAVPSVLDTLEVAKQKAFLEYIDKVSTYSEKEYLEEQMTGNFAGSCLIYNIENDIGLNNTGDYKGYVLIVKDSSGTTHYYVTLNDGTYMINGLEFDESLTTDDLENYISDSDKISVDYLASIGGCTEYKMKNDSGVFVSNKVDESKTKKGVTYESAESGETYIGILYLDPTNLSNECNSSNFVSDTGTKSGCMRFYVYRINGNYVDAILDHNTTLIVPWNTVNNINGPGQELMNALKNDTDGWVGIDSRNDTYSLNNGIANYTVDYSGYRARLISAEEVAAIAGDSSFDINSTQTTITFDEGIEHWTLNKYYWLFDRTYVCGYCGCKVSDNSTYGYWTSSAQAGNNFRAWPVEYDGTLRHYRLANTDTRDGVRPVITIPKSYIN